MTTASAVVATYRRTERLAACLNGLRSQRRPPDEVVVVVHQEDEPTLRFLQERAEDWHALRVAVVTEHGTVAAMNLCLGEARGEIVAFVDDDAVPAPDWLERIISTFERDGRIAGVGGRDLIVSNGKVLGPPARRLRADPNDVGRIQWWGRMLGNHHLGSGGARDVDVLKGANMSFRRATVLDHGFDERLRGRGAVVHTEMSICLPLRRAGLRVVYDPRILVTHYPAPRPYGYERVELRHEEVAASVHNETLQLLDFLTGPRRAVFLVWSLLVGTSVAPGLIIFGRDLITGRPAPWTRLRAALSGRAAAIVTARRPRCPSSVLRRHQLSMTRRAPGSQYPDRHRSAARF